MLFTIRVPNIPLYRKLLTKPMQLHILHVRRLAHVTKPCAGSERDGTGAGQNLRCIIEKDLIYDVRRQRRLVHCSAVFDHHAGNFQFSQPA